MSEYFVRSTPEAEGVDSHTLKTLLEYLKNPEMGIHSFMAVRHGKVISEAYWTPYAPEKPHTLFSTSKTFTGLAVGFAVQDGLLSLEDHVVDFFPERLPSKPGGNMQKMKVKHLLTMSTGFAKDPHDFPWPRPDDVNGTGPHCCHQGIELPLIDWVRNFFDHYVAYEPGTEFVYCTHATYMLSAIVQKVTGRTVSDYMNEKLFEPLGIGHPFWEEGPDGITVGGWGLMLTTEQMAVVGQFMLNEGQWKGRQLLSKEWIQDATRAHLDMKHLDEPHMAGYGYQIWVDEREGSFMFRGAFGQMIVVVPGKDLVLSWTSGAGGKAREDMMEVLWDVFISKIGEGDVPDDVERVKELRAVEASMQIDPEEGMASWEIPEAKQYSGVRYELGDNRLGFTAFSMKFAEKEGEQDEMTLEVNHRPFTVPVGFGAWAEGKTCVATRDTDTDVSIVFESIAVSGAWRDDKYCLTLCFDETSYINKIEVTFRGEGIRFAHTRNQSFFPGANAILSGVAL